ncbi:MAG: CgeB family protein [Oceanidesulfovibrio sp.]
MNAPANPLRVLAVQPLYGGSLTVGRYAVAALRELGHVVEVFEGPAFNGSFNALKSMRIASDRLDALESSFLQIVSQAVLAQVEAFEPDLVLAPAQAPLSRQALNRLRRDGVLTAMWFVEDHNLFTYWKGFAPHYDVFAVIQKEPFLSLLAEIGVEHALYLPLAGLESFHRPLELDSVEKRKYGADLSFLGAGYPNRRIAFRQLLHHDFKIWGSDWEGDPLLATRLQRFGERIEPEEAIKIFAASKINLNLHSSVRADPPVGHGDFVNPRTFELACCGAFQLVDERSLLGECFAGDELATFTNMESLLAAVDHYLARPEERSVMADKARRRAVRDHTYKARMRTLLAFIEERFPERLGAKRGEGLAAWSQSVPESMRGDVLALLERLQLSRDTSFKDLVWRLRQQQGALSSVETAILFLDEWQKQYGVRDGF